MNTLRQGRNDESRGPRSNDRGGNDRGGYNGGGRSFGGGGYNGGGQRGGASTGPREMHKATCAECNSECDVPFKPTQGKPVYCKDCFNKRRDKY